MTELEVLEGAVAASVSVRQEDESVLADLAFDQVGVEVFFGAEPWRMFRWHKGQKHYSGVYWSATEQGHVIYESRLELARLLYADFDPSVTRIVAQPFLMKAQVDGCERRHIPDFLLQRGGRPLVVDVKPAHRAARPEVAFTFDWCRRAVEARGWRYEVWSEPPVAELENLRFLAGYRRGWLIDAEVLEALGEVDLDGATLAEAFGCARRFAPALVRSAVLHRLWSGRLLTDLERPLSGGHVLRGHR